MKKKAILITSLLLVIILISSYVIYHVVQKQKYISKCNDAFYALFVTERGEVYSLYQAIDAAINTPDKEHYEMAFNAAVKAEQVSKQTYGDLPDGVATYDAGLVYYATFYKDIESAITSNCDIDVLKQIYKLLGKILSLYVAHYNSIETKDKSETKDMIEAISRFYKSISLLNDEMKISSLQG